ncbi:hypothetical protein C7410_115198 [Paraburkholderia silvatlantica]|uniref:Uncharacterized protein n=1 Tax=Paraburkholderia silvatlantica TaxID=321895 RepID=A0A2V4T733_9BURK|nr:hypothetical protein C7410_115198 [Paraburkholderia silvatlantica]
MFYVHRALVVLIALDVRLRPCADHPRKGNEKLVRKGLASQRLHYLPLHFFGVRCITYCHLICRRA